MDEIVEKINVALASIERDEKPRQYIGASAIGHPCLRNIWYSYKGVESDFESRSLMVFEFGRLIESLIMNMLKKSDVEVIGPTKSNNMLALHSQTIPEFKGHVDGFVIDGNNKYVLEIKSANNSQFNQCQKHGVKAWRAQYYAQVQAYMHFSDTFNAIFIVVNKDNSKFYVESIERDYGYYGALEDKAVQVKFAAEAPDRISKTPTYLTCKLCPYKKKCFTEDTK